MSADAEPVSVPPMMFTVTLFEQSDRGWRETTLLGVHGEVCLFTSEDAVSRWMRSHHLHTASQLRDMEQTEIFLQHARRLESYHAQMRAHERAMKAYRETVEQVRERRRHGRSSPNLLPYPTEPVPPSEPDPPQELDETWVPPRFHEVTVARVIE